MSRHVSPVMPKIREPVEYLLTAIDNAKKSLEETTDMVDFQSGLRLSGTEEYARLMDAFREYANRAEQGRGKGY